MDDRGPESGVYNILEIFLVYSILFYFSSKSTPTSSCYLLYCLNTDYFLCCCAKNVFVLQGINKGWSSLILNGEGPNTDTETGSLKTKGSFNEANSPKQKWQATKAGREKSKGQSSQNR